MGFNGNLEVRTSKELKISGLIGNASSLQVKSANVLENELGWEVVQVTGCVQRHQDILTLYSLMLSTINNYHQMLKAIFNS